MSERFQKHETADGVVTYTSTTGHLDIWWAVRRFAVQLRVLSAAKRAEVMEYLRQHGGDDGTR